MVAARACSRATIINKLEIRLRGSPYGRASSDSADAAQVDRVNVASSFRQAQWLQIVKSAKRSEIARPNFNQVFGASLSICSLISPSTVSAAYFWRIFEKSQLPAVGTGPRNFKSFYRENAAWNSGSGIRRRLSDRPQKLQIVVSPER
jgi:hypothetical protein